MVPAYLIQLDALPLTERGSGSKSITAPRLREYA